MVSDKNHIIRIGIREEVFDYVISGCTFWGAVLLYNIAKSGKKVALLTEKDFDRSDCFITTGVFPEKFSDIIESKKEIENINFLMERFQHLVLQQRSVFLTKRWGKKLLSLIFNLVVAKDNTEKSLFLKLRNYPEYSHLSESGINTGILSREFKVNETRLIIEILKEAEKCGASIFNKVKIKETGSDLFIIKRHLNSTEIKIKGKRVVRVKANNNVRKYYSQVETTGIKNSYRIISKNYEYALSQHSQGKLMLLVKSLNNYEIDNNDIVIKEFEELMPYYKGVFDKGEIFNEADFLPNTSHILTDNGLFHKPDMHEELLEVIGIDLSIDSLPLKISCLPSNINHISQLIELANKLYDEAKQTGINQEWFMELFYRFGSNIEIITEMAYSNKANALNTNEAWNSAVDNYEKQYEWK
jgi:hypothetical protein